MYAACRTMGIQRGVDEFVRFGVLERNGLAYTLVTLDRVSVDTRPEVLILKSLLEPLARVPERAKRAHAAARQATSAAVEFTRSPSPDALVAVLEWVTRTNLEIARSAVAREKIHHPLRVDRDAVLSYLHDQPGAQTPERLIALTVTARRRPLDEGRWMTVRGTLLPVSQSTADPHAEAWSDRAIVQGVASRPVAETLADLVHVFAVRGAGSSALSIASGVQLWTRDGPWLSGAEVNAWIAGRVDDAVLRRELLAFLALDSSFRSPTRPVPRPRQRVVDPVALTLSALARGLPRRVHAKADMALSTTDSQGTRGADIERSGWQPEWARRLRMTVDSGMVEDIRRRALQRGWELALSAPGARLPDAGRVLRVMTAALMGPADVLSELSRITTEPPDRPKPESPSQPFDQDESRDQP